MLHVMSGLFDGHEKEHKDCTPRLHSLLCSIYVPSLLQWPEDLDVQTQPLSQGRATESFVEFNHQNAHTPVTPDTNSVLSGPTGWATVYLGRVE